MQLWVRFFSLILIIYLEEIVNSWNLMGNTQTLSSIRIWKFFLLFSFKKKGGDRESYHSGGGEEWIVRVAQGKKRICVEGSMWSGDSNMAGPTHCHVRVQPTTTLFFYWLMVLYKFFFCTIVKPIDPTQCPPSTPLRLFSEIPPQLFFFSFFEKTNYLLFTLLFNNVTRVSSEALVPPILG